MEDGLAKFVGTAIGVALIGYGIYYAIQQNPLLIWVPIGIVVVGIIGFFVYTAANQAHVETNISEGIPNGSPMQVKLRTEQLKEHKHRLHIDVRMSPEDWEALKQSGMANAWLFEAKNVTSMDNHYAVGHLLRVHKVDFEDIQALQRAKDKLVENLHIMRGCIDGQKERKKAGPAATSESFEI